MGEQRLVLGGSRGVGPIDIEELLRSVGDRLIKGMTGPPVNLTAKAVRPTTARPTAAAGQRQRSFP